MLKEMENIFTKAFAETVKCHKMSQVYLAKESDVEAASISRFLKGVTDLRLSSMSRLFLALPYEARKTCCEKLLGEEIPTSELKLADLIARLDPSNKKDRKEAADAIRLITEKMLR